MAEARVRIKGIIMDKAPAGGTRQMVSDLGYTPNDYTPLANELNAEFNLTLTAGDLQNLATVEDVYNYVNNLLP